MVGQNIAHYRVTEKLGAGGMGEVYRARDSRLSRDVAVKVLPQLFARDAERMARFEREAQVLASLNHPNIATIHGLEEAPGTRALVMELVEGPTLAGRIAQGPVPLDEALHIAKQIAEALEYAHERGIIHRDLKPANVKVTPDGKVKVLDFGLAKALEDAPAAVDIATSPTLTAAATKAGIILGTAAYMSPEQAKGKSVDRRADIWAFGVLLHEMLSGQQLYTGETASETMAAVIMKEPDFTTLPDSVPPRIRQLLRRCLTRDPKQRLRDIGEARIALDEYLANPGEVSAAAPAAIAIAAPLPLWRRALPWAGTVLFALVALVTLWRPWQSPPKSTGVVRLNAELGADATLGTAYGPNAILSPDGTRLAFAAQDSSRKWRLYIRALDQMQASPLSGTDGVRDPFFSPDGQWIAFFADSKLKKISVQGGAAVTLCDVQEDRGGAWGEDGNIFFTPATRVGLSRISSAGGTPQPFTTLDKQTGDVTHRWPQVLPGGKAVLFTSSSDGNNYEDADIAVQALPTGEKKTVYRGGFFGRYLPSGHLVFVHEGTMFAVPFDLKRLEVTGQPAPVLEEVVSNSGTGGAQFSSSQNGTLVYLSGRGVAQDVSIYWMGHDGKTVPLRDKPGDYGDPMFSPDGKLLALEISEGRREDIWVYDWQRDTLTRLTFTGGANLTPVWTPDGKRITYSMRDPGPLNIYWKRADGAGDAQRLTESKLTQYPQSWRPDGKVLALRQSSPDTSWDILTLTMEGNEQSGWKPGELKPFLNSPFVEVDPVFSPDGRWLAYMSNESGTFEVYVRPFPGPGGKWQISTGGGVLPKWSRNGKEFFYRTMDSKIMVLNYTGSGDSFRADKPRLWSEGQFTDRGPNSNYDLHPDGKRFAVLKAPGAEAQSQINKVAFIFSFFDELRRKLASAQP